ncbi:hypothetical protein ACFPRL_23640 [Pseudoclavibacter helvolus]
MAGQGSWPRASANTRWTQCADAVPRRVPSLPGSRGSRSVPILFPRDAKRSRRSSTSAKSFQATAGTFVNSNGPGIRQDEPRLPSAVGRELAARLVVRVSYPGDLQNVSRQDRRHGVPGGRLA